MPSPANPKKQTLVIVESKAKAPKIEQILGAGFKVLPCFGHLQNIPRSGKWIDAHRESGWDPDQIPYEKNPDKFSADALAKLRSAAKSSSAFIIASDMDREGEAIGYHLRDLLKLPASRTQRIVFDQITPQAIRDAVDNPTDLREPLYRAQQARRVIDQIFGYSVSPLLWDIQQRLSAGRCQSPALRWLWERQEAFLQIKHVPAVHHITAQLLPTTADSSSNNSHDRRRAEPCVAKYVKPESTTKRTTRRTTKVPPASLATSSEHEKHAILHELEMIRKWQVETITHTQPRQSPPTPFTTSALQQRCYQRFKWSPKATMSYAQKLYEAGLITYMRTDCKRLAAPFVSEATRHLLTVFGAQYVQSTSKPATGSGKKSSKQALAQEAHEPIRPTHADHSTFTSADQKAVGTSVAAPCAKLYTLIYQTTMSSLMTPCVLNKHSLQLSPYPASPQGHGDSHRLTMDWTGIHFPGWRVWEVLDVPRPFQPPKCPYTEGDVLDTLEYVSEIKHPISDRPYTAGDLLKLLETRGVGRPSTYSSILEKLEQRKYVAEPGSGLRIWQEKLEGHPLTQLHNETVTINMRRLPKPTWSHEKTEPDVAKQLQDRYCVTPLGDAVTRFLVTRLVDLVDAEFTQKLESQLDEIVKGKATYQKVVGGFYNTLTERVAKLKEELQEHQKALRQQGKSTRSKEEGGPSAPSPFATFDNGVSKRVLEDNGDHAYVAMLTRNGPAVALLYADKARKGDGVFASLPATTTVQEVSLSSAKQLIARKQKSVASGVMSEEGVKVGTYKGAVIHAKSGRYGNYLTWTDVATGVPQTTAFGDRNIPPETVTLAQASAWVDSAKLLLRKVDSTFSIRYNPEWDTVFVSKKPAGGRGRPTYATLEGFTPQDINRIQKLTVAEVKELYERGQQAKQQRRATKVTQKKDGGDGEGTGNDKRAERRRGSRGEPPAKVSKRVGAQAGRGGGRGRGIARESGTGRGCGVIRKRTSSRKAPSNKVSRKTSVAAS
jgi:DNA topoisomerase-1